MRLEAPFNTSLLISSAVLFTVSVAFFIARMLNNISVLKRILWDDVLTVAVFMFYAAVIALANVSAGSANNLFAEGQLATIMADPVAIKNRVLGSIAVVTLEQCVLLTRWGLKVALLGFIWRLSYGLILKRRFAIAIISYVALSFVCLEVLYYAVLCRPFTQYWAIPVRDSECATYSTYSKIAMAFNTSSDLMIICLPAAIIIHFRLPRKRSIILVGVLGLALFTAVAGVLNMYYRISSPETTVYVTWCIYEISVAFWIGQVVHCWNLLQKIFGIRSFDDKRSYMPRVREMEEYGLETQTRASSWWCRYVTHVPSPFHDDPAVERGYRQNRNRSADIDPDTRRHTTASFKLALGADDAGPAIAYRAANHID